MFLLCERGTVQPFPSPAGSILISPPRNIGKADFTPSGQKSRQRREGGCGGGLSSRERRIVQPFPSPAGPILISSPQNIGKADFIVIRSTAEAV